MGYGIRNRTINYGQRLVVAQELTQRIYEFDNAQISHRDVKPQNILIRKRNNQMEWVICDFGITKTVRGAVDIEGTPGFSPDKITYSSNSDFYSVGLTIIVILFTE